MLTVEVREGCPFSYYKDYIAPALPPVTNNMSGSIVSAVAQASKLDGIIGYGSIPIADIGPSAKSVWVELTKGGGRVRLDVQFCEFVDPQDL